MSHIGLQFNGTNRVSTIVVGYNNTIWKIYHIDIILTE